MHTRYSEPGPRRLISATYLATCAMPYLRCRARPVRPRVRVYYARMCVHVCMYACMRVCAPRGAHAKALSSRICIARALVFGAFSIVWISNDSAPLVGCYLYTRARARACVSCVCACAVRSTSADSGSASPPVIRRAIGRFSILFLEARRLSLSRDIYLYLYLLSRVFHYSFT